MTAVGPASMMNIEKQTLTMYSKRVEACSITYVQPAFLSVLSSWRETIYILSCSELRHNTFLTYQPIINTINNLRLYQSQSISVGGKDILSKYKHSRHMPFRNCIKSCDEA